jgi:hypothetical protein
MWLTLSKKHFPREGIVLWPAAKTPSQQENAASTAGSHVSEPEAEAELAHMIQIRKAGGGPVAVENWKEDRDGRTTGLHTSQASRRGCL